MDQIEWKILRDAFIEEYHTHSLRIRRELNLRWRADATIRNKARNAFQKRRTYRVTDVLFPDGAPLNSNVGPDAIGDQESHALEPRRISEASHPGP